MTLSIRIIKNEEGDYTALCAELPGCVSRGRTRDQAKENLDEAIRGYLAAIGNFIPERYSHEVIEV